MMKPISIILLLVLISAIALSQDTAFLYFKGIKVCYNKEQNRIEVISADNNYYETITPLGNNKFLYAKSSKTDSVPIALGQLGLYSYQRKLYLLREGVWATELLNEKVWFENPRNGLVPGEYPTSTDPEVYSPRRQRKKERHARAVTITRSNKDNP